MAGDLILVSLALKRCSGTITHIFQIADVSGYIGFKTLVLALESRFKLRAFIRKAEQAKKLESHGRVAPDAKNLQRVLILDLSKRTPSILTLRAG
jgi:hypothetical protein